MTLNELNESYDEYVLTDEYYLEEGLKFFKKSKRLYSYVDRINKRLAKAESKNKVSPSDISRLKALSKSVLKLADEYKVIEDDFGKGKTDKKLSKEKIKRINRDNDRLVVLLKKNETKQAFKKLGIGALVLGLGAVLVQLGMTPQIAGLLSKTTTVTASSFAPRGATVN